MYTPVNPSFTIWKWGLRGSKLYRHVLVMRAKLRTCTSICRRRARARIRLLRYNDWSKLTLGGHVVRYTLQVICDDLRRIYTLAREVTLPELICLRSEKGSILKGKNLLPMGANNFLLEKIPCQKGPGVQESKMEVTKVVSLVINVRTSNKGIKSMYHAQWSRCLYNFDPLKTHFYIVKLGFTGVNIIFSYFCS